ncbi:thiamine phosphate synthase [Novosphingobium tardum]|uniref:Thiamine phosphate synthase n=1 Tax=Novosphingobium tardum TaxID=1538021 RepID=A0ABV8RMG3_9SPHN
MTARQSVPLPRMWLVSDARNDTVLDRAIRHLPRGSGLIFRHYHLAPGARRNRFAAVARLCRARGVVIVLAANVREARRWGADGSYGPPARGTTLATVHSLAELAQAVRAGASAAVVSPVFPTRSHPGAAVLGPVRFLLIAARSPLPVIALGGMTAARAARLPAYGWAAIDGLSGNT